MCASFNFWQTNSRLMFCTFWNWVETLGQQRVIDIFAHSLAAKDLLCVFRNWGCRKFFHRKDTFVCFFLTGGPLVTNNSWLRMITVSEIVRICQTSNYLLDINWPSTVMQNLMIRKYDDLYKRGSVHRNIWCCLKSWLKKCFSHIANIWWPIYAPDRSPCSPMDLGLVTLSWLTCWPFPAVFMLCSTASPGISWWC